MEPRRERYRKLPGHRRGILRGASLWLGSDHLLSVKSLRFREEYKRFYLRDVQAIVVARVPRFHVSTRVIGIACLWLTVFLLTRSLEPWVPAALGSAIFLMVCAWVYASYARSCRCRIYTAVSCDELPSIYRTWTARKLLEQIEPRIREAQGVLEGDWAEAVDGRDVGPPGAIRRIPVAPPPLLYPNPGAPSGPAQSPGVPSRTAVSDVFVTSLFADALLNLATLHSLTRATQWVWYSVAFVEIAGAILIFVQRYRGLLGAGMQKLAISALIAMGVSYYLRQVVEGVSRATHPLIPAASDLSSAPGYLVIREVDAGICLVLGAVGVALSLMSRGRE